MTQASATELATNLIKQWEGCRLHPYRDEAGIWTVGYGMTHIGQTTVTGYTLPITQEQADAMLAEEVARVADRVASLVTAPINDCQRAALLDFAYNLGCGSLHSSTLLKLVNDQRYYDAAQEFGKWVYIGTRYSRGLANRREAERLLFTSAGPVSMIETSPSSTDDLNAQELERIKA